MISTGAMSINEARGMEDLNPVDDDIGSQLFMQGAMTTVEKIVSQPAPMNPSARPGKQTSTHRLPEDDKQEEDEEDDDETEMDASVFLPVFSDAEARVNRKESMAVSNTLRKHPKTSPALTEWAGQFFGEHASYIVDAFTPAIQSVEHARKMIEPGWQVPAGHAAAISTEYCSRHAGIVAKGKAPEMIAGELADRIMSPLLVGLKPGKAPKVATLQPLVMNITVDDSNAKKSLSVERDAKGRMTGVTATSTKTKALAIARDKYGQIVGMQ
jgi:hypothetical protein